MPFRSVSLLRRSVGIPLFAAAASITCGDGTGPGEPEYALDVTAEGATTLTTLGLGVQLGARLTRDGEAASGTVSWLSRDPAVASVSEGGLVSARRNGSTWIVASGPEETRDSIRVTVAFDVRFLLVSPRQLHVYAGDTVRLQATLKDALGQVLPMQPTWSVEPGARATVDSTGLVTGLSPGTGLVIARDGTAQDAAGITVYGRPVLSFATGQEITIGVGQFAPVQVTSDLTLGPALAMPVSSSAPAIAVMHDSARIASSGRSGTAHIAGVSPGTAIVRVVSFGTETAPLTVTVTPPRVVIGATGGGDPAPIEQDTVFVIEGQTRGLVAMIGSATGWLGLRRVAPLEVRLRSSDTTVAKLTDTIVTIASGGGSSPELGLTARAAGVAAIIATAPGHVPDTFHVRVGAPKLRFSASGGADIDTQVIGVGQRLGDVLTLSIPPELYAGPFTVTVTQRHPEIVRVSPTIAIGQGQFAHQFRFGGLARGVDTLIVSAPGAEPDTLVAVVGTPKLRLTLLGSGSGSPVRWQFRFLDSLGGWHSLLHARTFAASTLDPAVATVVAPFVRVDSGWFGGTVEIVLQGSGRTAIVVRDSADAWVPDTSDTFDVQVTPLRVSTGLSSADPRSPSRSEAPFEPAAPVAPRASGRDERPGRDASGALVPRTR